VEGGWGTAEPDARAATSPAHATLLHKRSRGCRMSDGIIRRTSDAEEPTRDFLGSADLCDRAVDLAIEIDRKRLLMSTRDFYRHWTPTDDSVAMRRVLVPATISLPEYRNTVDRMQASINCSVQRASSSQSSPESPNNSAPKCSAAPMNPTTANQIEYVLAARGSQDVPFSSCLESQSGVRQDRIGPPWNGG
jgi:hypothetical protein